MTDIHQPTTSAISSSGNQHADPIGTGMIEVAAHSARSSPVPGSAVWVPVADRLPDHGCKVLACYLGVYECRVVDFWRDASGGAHFGYPESNPATHWMPCPLPPNNQVTDAKRSV